MADYVYPVQLAAVLTGYIARVPPRFTGVMILNGVLTTGDQRALTGTHGSILNNNVVKVKPDPESPELPVPGARVSVHDLHDGVVRWVGKSDATGHYYPSNLTPDNQYFVVAIDESETYEAVAAGPVVAKVKLWDGD